MGKHDKAFFVACVMGIIIVGIGSRKLSLAWPEYAWLAGTFNGILQTLLFLAAGKVSAAPTGQ